MKRILVLCGREWAEGQKNLAAQYAHEVFRRIGAQGYSVAWFAHRPIALFSPKSRMTRLETRDNIQFARLGPMLGYRFSVRLVLERLEKLDSGHPFDILVDCVERTPLPLQDREHPRPLSIVFQSVGPRFAKRLSCPLISATPEATASLDQRGIPQGHIIRAYAGSTGEEWDQVANLVLAAIENLEHEPVRRPS